MNSDRTRGPQNPALTATLSQVVRVRGFSLVELMIVVAIIAILCAIAVPSYRNHVLHGNRNSAEGVMLDMAAAEERYLIDNRSYTASAAQLGYASYPDNLSSNYMITVAYSSSAPTVYTISATPTGSQVADTCSVLTLTNTGAKGPANTTCWQ